MVGSLNDQRRGFATSNQFMAKFGVWSWNDSWYEQHHICLRTIIVLTWDSRKKCPYHFFRKSNGKIPNNHNSLRRLKSELTLRAVIAAEWFRASYSHGFAIHRKWPWDSARENVQGCPYFPSLDVFPDVFPEAIQHRPRWSWNMFSKKVAGYGYGVRPVRLLHWIRWPRWNHCGRLLDPEMKVFPKKNMYICILGYIVYACLDHLWSAFDSQSFSTHWYQVELAWSVSQRLMGKKWSKAAKVG